MPTIFSRIINGEIPCYKIAEEEDYFAFLDINPIKKGHTLVIPKVENDYVFRLDDKTIAGLFVFAKKVGLAIEKAIPCKRIGIAVIGLEVPHLHLHLVPIDGEGDLNFNNPKLKFDTQEMNAIAENIRTNFI